MASSLFHQVGVAQSGCFVRKPFGCGLPVSACGSCVVVSCANAAGAVRRNCCGDYEADAYTAQETVVARLSAISK